MPERNLYLTNIPAEEALKRFQAALEPHFIRKQEVIQVTDSLNRVTAGAVYARYNSPLYDSAAMDGAAVVSARTRGASETSPLTLIIGEDFVPVDTGNPVRPPYDAVIKAEDIREINSGAVRIHSAAAAGRHIRRVGEDITKGELILPEGVKIRPIDIGVLLSGGITEISVIKRLEAAVIPTGSEMIEPGDEIKDGCIIESNSRMLEALIRQSGSAAARFSPIPDDYDVMKERIWDASKRFDMVLVCAGTSAGREDYTVHVLRELGDVVVHGVAMKPGKPVILAVVNGKPVIGVPGYPVSAYLSYECFAAPVLAAFSNLPEPCPPTVKAVLTRRLVSSLKHREYVRVKIEKSGDKLMASPLARGAGAAMSLVKADGFCVIEQDDEGIEAGTEVNISLLRDI
jgi:putative molybdopterin biosynthesis protein